MAGGIFEQPAENDFFSNVLDQQREARLEG
jgi:hypothetical protein